MVPAIIAGGIACLFVNHPVLTGLAVTSLMYEYIINKKRK